jgi:hypothetical protein
MAEQRIDATTTPIRITSRHRGTRIYKDVDLNQVYFGTWKVPRIREVRPVSYHIVTPDEVTRPDRISDRVYGRSDLWWAIAVRNGILLPIIDIVPGQSLSCPHLDDITAALGISGVNMAGTT